MSDLIDRDYMLSQIEKAKAENRPFDYDSLIDFVKVLPKADFKAELEEIKEEIMWEANGQFCVRISSGKVLQILDNHIKENENDDT